MSNTKPATNNLRMPDELFEMIPESEREILSKTVQKMCDDFVAGYVNSNPQHDREKLKDVVEKVYDDSNARLMAHYLIERVERTNRVLTPWTREWLYDRASSAVVTSVVTLGLGVGAGALAIKIGARRKATDTSAATEAGSKEPNLFSATERPLVGRGVKAAV